MVCQISRRKLAWFTSWMSNALLLLGGEDETDGPAGGDAARLPDDGVLADVAASAEPDAVPLLLVGVVATETGAAAAGGAGSMSFLLA